MAGETLITHERRERDGCKKNGEEQLVRSRCMPGALLLANL
jgi:hypothetical protein